jgi:Putative phage abortive infection protein
MKNGDNEGQANATASMIVALILILGFWLLTLFVLGRLEPNIRGTFGDMFGGLNALFSGFAFVGLIYAILLQRQDLSLQRQELRATRKELAGQREEQEKQNKFLELQTFENTFFQMLRTLNDIVNSIDLRNPNGTITEQGRDCFLVFEGRLFRLIQQRAPSDLKCVGDVYSEYYRKYRQEVGHYYRVLYNLVKFVDQSQIADKRFYTNIVRAQLSDAEVYLLFYNCLSKLGAEKFKPLVEKYALLKMIQSEILFDKSHNEFYASKAFG